MSMTRWLGIVLLVFGGVALLWVGGREAWRAVQYRQQSAAVARPPVTGANEVAIQEFAYAAPHIAVAQGTLVTWTNRDSVAHDVLFSDGSAQSTMLQRGQTFAHTFATPGSYAYVCSAHPFMVGKITVVR